MKHFIHQAGSYAAKNKLHKAIHETLKSYDNLLLVDVTRDEFLDIIRNEVNNLNDKHPRCKPERVSTYNINDSDIGLIIGDIMVFHIYGVKNEL
jgi:hypothetical protein